MATHYSNRFERKHYTTQSRHITTTPDSGSTVFTNDLVFNDVLLETGPAKILVLDDSNMLKYKDEGGEFIASDLDLIHTATSNNDSALYIQTNDDTIYTDHSAIDINYKLTNPNPGLGAIINANFDIDDTVSGTIYGANFKRGNGTADITALNVGQNINVINQETGNLQNIGLGFINAIDHTADFNDPLILNNILVNDNDYIEIGSPSQFSQVFILLDTGANLDCQVDFEYWNGSAFVFLSVLDGTQGFRVSGSLSLSPPGDWSLNAGTYNIRAVRRRNNLTTTPILQQVQISSTIQLYWDRDGLLRVANLEIFSVGGNTTNEKILYYNDATKRVEFRDTQEVLNDKYSANFINTKINDNMLITSTDSDVIKFTHTPISSAGAKITTFSTTADSGYFVDVINNSVDDTNGHTGIRLISNTPGGDTFQQFSNVGQNKWTIGLKDSDELFRMNYSGADDYLNDDSRTRLTLNTFGQLVLTNPLVNFQSFLQVRNISTAATTHSYLHLQTDYNGTTAGGNNFVLYQTGANNNNWTVGKKINNNFNWNYNATGNDFLNGAGVMNLTPTGALTANGTITGLNFNVNNNALITTTNDSIFTISQTPAATTGPKCFSFVSNTSDSILELEVSNIAGTGTGHSALSIRTPTNTGNMFSRYFKAGSSVWVNGFQSSTNTFRWNYDGTGTDFLTNDANTKMFLTTTGNLTLIGETNTNTLLIQNAPSTPAEDNVLTYNTTTKSVGYRPLPGAIEGLCSFVDSNSSTIPIVNIGTNVAINNTNVVNMSVGINNGDLTANATTGQFTYSGPSQIYVMIHMEFSITSATTGNQEIELESVANGFVAGEMTFTTHAMAGSYTHVSSSRIASLVNGSLILFNIRNNTSTDDVIVRNLEISAHTLHSI